MKRILKWLVGILTTLIVLVIIVVLALPVLLDPNRYRQEISDLVHQETGMYLTIHDDIGWSVFPWLGLSINNVTIDDVQQQRLATLKHVAVSVEVKPLFAKQIRISDIELDGVDANLVVNKNGVANWTPVLRPSEPSQPTEPTAPATDDESSLAFAMKDFSVAGITIKDINVSYKDEATKQNITIKNAKLVTGAFAFGQPFQLNASLDLDSRDPAIKANIAFSTLMTSVPDKDIYNINDLTLTVTPAASKPEKIQLTGNLTLKDKALQGKVALKPFDLATAMSQLNMPLPALAGGSEVLRKVSIGTSVDANSNSIALSDMFATVDEIELKGAFAITNLKTSEISFNLTGNAIVVDPYLPAAQPAQDTAPATSTAPATAADANAVIIPVDMIKALNIAGKATLDSLSVSGFMFEQPTLEILAKNGNARITNLHAGFYEGTIKIAAGVNVAGSRASNPETSANINVNGISLPALATQIEVLNKITGVANANVAITAQGLSQARMLSSLNGTIDFQLADGALLGVNFNQLLCSVIARVRKEELSRTDWPNETAFTSLGGTAKIVNGVVYNDDLSAALAVINLKGDGDVNLVNQSIDYHIGLTVTGDTSGEDRACRINEQYNDIAWPMECKGKLTDTGLCGIDEERLLSIAGGLVQDTIKNKVQEKLEETFNEKIGDKLQGLQNIFKK